MSNKNPIIQKLLSVPVWVKILGIVVLPLLLVIFGVALYARTIIVSTPEAQVVTGTISEAHGLLTRQIIVAAVIALGIGMALAYGLSRILIHPVRQLLEIIQEIDAGNLEARVPIWAEDEIGQVQRAFNHMTARLEQADDQLKELNRRLLTVNNLSREVSLSQDIDSVLDVVLKQAITLLSADIAVIFKVDSSMEYVDPIAYAGEIPTDILDIFQTQRISARSMESLAEEKLPVRMNDLASEEHAFNEIKDVFVRSGISHVAHAPIQTGGKPLGSIYLARKTGSPFDQNDAITLESIGNVIGFGMTNMQLLDGLKHKEAELRYALRRSVELQEEERNRLSRELHDETSQALTSILIRLRLLQDEQDLEIIRDRINGMRYLTSQTIDELRRIAMDLRPAMLDNLGIVPALRWLIQQTEEQTGAKIDFVALTEVERFSPEIELALYRIAQEAITNAIRHAEASQITVILERGPHVIWLIVQDDGKGFDLEAIDRGLGIVGMRERVDLLNGLFNIETSPGSGTHLWVEVQA